MLGSQCTHCHGSVTFYLYQTLDSYVCTQIYISFTFACEISWGFLIFAGDEPLSEFRTFS